MINKALNRVYQKVPQSFKDKTSYLLDKRDKNKHGSFSFPLHTGPMGYIVYCRKPGHREGQK